MSVRVQHNPKTARTKVQLVLPDDIHDGPVSVVGTFNDWTPGAHKLVRRSNGTRSVAIEVDPGTDMTFRYLGSGGRWFDDPEVDAVDYEGMHLHV